MDFGLIEKTLRPGYYKKQINKAKQYAGISPVAYFQLIARIDDDYLTDWEVLKFQQSFKTKMFESYIIPFGLGVGFFLAAPRLLGLYSHRQIFYRWYKLTFSATMTIGAYSWINTQFWSNKNFHDLVTQPEPNGKYLRTILKDTFPNHWSMISEKLHELGYNFKEMNEYSENAYMPDVNYKFDDSRY